MEQMIKEENVKALIFCNPHNPVGRVWTREEMEKVAEICLKYNVIWMVDEMHCDFIFPGHEFTSCMNLDKNFMRSLHFTVRQERHLMLQDYSQQISLFQTKN